MYQIDNATASPTRPASTAAGTAGYFTDGSAVGGVPATVVPAEWLNAVQTELINAITAAGIVPSKALFNQLSSAIQSMPAGRLINIQVITASRIYAKSAGTKAVQAITQGAGGAGGGTGVTSSGQVAAAGGGAGGAFAVSSLITSGFDGTAVTIGAGGVPVSGGSGGAGGATSFGAFLSAPGGAGAVVQSSQPLPGFGAPGQNSAAPSGSALAYGSVGNDGLNGTTYLTAVTLGGKGADSLYGAGGGAPGTSSTGVKADGRAGKGYGAGGSGGATASSGPASIGGAGAPGLAIVFEYS